MKKSLILVGMLAIGFAKAQEGKVGINTQKPNATLDVKAKTNDGSKVLELQNSAETKLVTALDNGNVGINTPTPTQKLDIEGNARVRQMTDATTLESTYTKAVVADANGNLAVVSRTTPNLPNSTQVIFSNVKVPTDIMASETFYSIQQNINSRGAFYFRNSGQSITLPPGKWVVYGAFLVSPVFDIKSRIENNSVISHNVWVRGSISDNNQNELVSDFIDFRGKGIINSSPLLVSTNISPDQTYNVANGLWFVDNNTTANKTYYLKISIEPTNFISTDTQKLSTISRWAEDYLVAVRRQ